MKRWILFGDRLLPSVADDLYVNIMGNLVPTLMTAGMIAAYHIIFHM